MGQIYPVPTGLVGIDDPVLSNPRTPPIGSITDLSVNAVANIAQGKLLFNGSPPPVWVGSGSGQMAAGDLVERVANKGVPGGYAALDSGGRIPSTHVDAGTEAGTVSHIELMMPPEMNVAGSPITDNGTFTTNWNDVPGESWFGVHGREAGAVPRPSFLVGPLPAELVPSIDAAKFTTGVFPPEVLPVAEGFKRGMIPDLHFRLPTDYLGRIWSGTTTAPDVLTMPTAPMPVISLIRGRTGSGGDSRLSCPTHQFYPCPIPKLCKPRLLAGKDETIWTMTFMLFLPCMTETSSGPTRRKMATTTAGLLPLAQGRGGLIPTLFSLL